MCVCVHCTLAPALATDTGRGQIGGHLVTLEVSRKRWPLNHAHMSGTHVRLWGWGVSGIQPPSLSPLWVVAAAFGHKVSRQRRQDGPRPRGRLRAYSAPPSTRPASSGLFGWHLFLQFVPVSPGTCAVAGRWLRVGPRVEACVGSGGSGHVLEHSAPHFLVDPACAFRTGGPRPVWQVSRGRQCRGGGGEWRPARCGMRHGRACARASPAAAASGSLRPRVTRWHARPQAQAARAGSARGPCSRTPRPHHLRPPLPS